VKKFDKVHLSEEQERAICALIEDFEAEDEAVRQRQIRTWKKMEFYWAGFQQIWWDDVAHDWRIYGSGGAEDNDDQSSYYDKNINVFRAYLETIISALSETVPPVKCLPDNGEDTNDVLTAQNGTRIAELVYNHIDAPLLWMRALWIHSLQGMVAAYNYTDEDKEYGEVSQPKYEDTEEEVEGKTCPNCGMELAPDQIAQSNQLAELERNEYDPGDDDIVLHSALNSGKILCPQCMIEVDPEISHNKVIITRITGSKMQAKARQCIEVNGGLFVKIPNWARNQKEMPYLGYMFETHTSNVIAKYPELRDKFNEIASKAIASDTEGNQSYERWGRISPQYRGELPTNTPTEKHWWLRNSAFNSVRDDRLSKSLQKKFPDGCYAIKVNDHFVKACNESLDDHWTITVNPESNYVHYDPLAILVTSVQEITSDLVSLELQCIEHSVPITFADPRFVNFTQYANNEIKPGALVPTKHIPGGKGISDGFHTLQTATVSPELSPFGAKINEMGQFVSGALPSVFGGAQPNSSRTASQYAMSRQQALQRLRITWKMLNFWWKNIFGKVIPAYMKDMLEDERLVTEKGDNSFETIVIKKAQMEGKIGSIKLEAPEGLPITMEQVADRVMELLGTGNEEIIAALGAPENLPIMRETFGLSNFYIPGEDDRDKQFEEIALLLNSGPLQTPPNPMSPQGGEQPSIMPEMMVDNHKIEAEICRAWLVGAHGRQAKVDNPPGYKNILLHMLVHIQMGQQLMAPAPPPMQQQQQAPQGPQGPAKPKLVKPAAGAQ